jgi:hypothetical protein
VPQGAGERHSHRRISDVAQDAAVQRSHRIGMLWTCVENAHRLAFTRALDAESKQISKLG